MAFYVGPYCDTDTSNLYLGAFYDEYCRTAADASYFMSLNYGNGFPYFYEPILAPNDCITCQNMEQDANGGDDDDGYPEPNQLCQASTEEATWRCDTDRGYQNGCYFLSTTLPCLDGRYCPVEEEETNDNDGSSSGGSGSSSSGTLANTKDKVSQWFSWNGLESDEQTLVAIALACALFLFLVLIIGGTCWCRRCCENNNNTASADPITKSRRHPLLAAVRGGGGGSSRGGRGGEPRQNDQILNDRSLDDGSGIF